MLLYKIIIIKLLSQQYLQIIFLSLFLNNILKNNLQ